MPQAVLLQIPRRVPNTTVLAGGGGLGWSGGMALGAKLAAPDRLMVQICGDGGFYFGNPDIGVRGRAAIQIADPLHRARQFRLERGEAIDAARLSGRRGQDREEFEAELAPDVHFSKVGEAFGAYAEELSDPAEVPAALARCVKEVRGGRAALLHARVTKM